MKLDPELNIWGSLDEFSGRDKGRVYAQRAHYMLGKALENPTEYERLFLNGKVRRKILAGDIGCDRSALYDNPEIKALISKLEGREVARPSSKGEEDVADIDSPLLPHRARAVLERLRLGCGVASRDYGDRVIATDQTCKIDGRIYSLPTIILNGKIEVEASDWLRNLVLTNAIETSTASQYAKVMRAFLRHCHRKKRDWFNVDDQFLISWRDGRRGRVDDAQVVSDLNIVFQFYVWAELTNVLSYHVGIYETGNLPAGFTRHDFPISARRKKSAKVGGRTGWASTLAFRVSKSVEGRRHTPNDHQVRSVHEELLKATQGERDSLIAAWAEEAGPRRSEILQLRRSDVPSDEELGALIANEENAEISIARRKRRSKAPVRANPFLLIATKNWIDGGRQKIVEECRAKIKGYRNPDEIFISSTTGKVLAADSVTKIMGAAFKRAGVKNASLHRLRAKAIVQELESYVDAFLDLNIVIEPSSQWAETILVKVAEMAGHAQPWSLRPYLNYVLHRRLSLTEADRKKRQGEVTRDLERRAAAAKMQLAKSEAVMTAIDLFRKGRRDAAADMLRRLHEPVE